VPLALSDFFSSDGVVNRHPLGHHAEICLNFQQVPENQRFGLTDGLFNCQHADKVIADPQMITFGLNIGIRHLIVEKLSASWLAVDPPVVVI